jgi:hypothetical protein
MGIGQCNYYELANVLSLDGWNCLNNDTNRADRMYFNYHATAMRLIQEGKLLSYYYTDRHNHISPALVLVFNDMTHSKMPIRKDKWGLYESYLKMVSETKL